jgi:hypothetical protein
MPQALIKLAYQHIIDINSGTPFEQEVFNATFAEFTFQQQSFSKGDKTLTSWSAIKEKFPKANPALPFKVSFAIAGLLQSLDKKIPGLEDTLHLKPVHFISHYFQLIESDVNDRSLHRVSIIYLTDTLTYFGSLGNTLLVAHGDIRHTSEDQPAQTFLLRMEDSLSIFSYVDLARQPAEISVPGPFALQA